MSEAVSEGPDTENAAAASRDAFARWVDDAPEGRAFGQVIVRPTSTGGYVVRHTDDTQTEGLERSEDPRAAREIARLTETGEYRPLKSSPNLRRGWELRVADARALAIAMDYLYPAGVVHWFLHREGKLGLTSFRQNAARQSGIYKRIAAALRPGRTRRGPRLLRGRGVPQKDPVGRGRGDSARHRQGGR